MGGWSVCCGLCVWFEGLWFVVCVWVGGVVGVFVCAWRFRIVPMTDRVVWKAQSGGECGWSGTSAKLLAFYAPLLLIFGSFSRRK